MTKEEYFAICKEGIALFSEQTGIPVFQYDMIHRKMENQDSNYDFNKVIDTYARSYIVKDAVCDKVWKNGREEAKKKLIEMGVLIPVGNGEFTVRFDEQVTLDKKPQQKNGCIYISNLNDAVKSVPGVYQLFAEEFARKKEIFSSSEIDLMCQNHGLDSSLMPKTEVDEYKKYLESSYGVAYAYAFALSTSGYVSMDAMKKAGKGKEVEDCNDEILKAVKRAVKDAQQEGTFVGYAKQGLRWLGCKITGKEYTGISYSKDELFDKKGRPNGAAFQEMIENIVKDKALAPDEYNSKLENSRKEAEEKAKKRANSKLWRTVDFFKSGIENTKAFFNDKVRSVKRSWNKSIFSEHGRLDRKIKNQLKKEINTKVRDKEENVKAAREMEKIMAGMQLLTLETNMDPLSGELLKTMLKTQIKNGNSFGKGGINTFISDFTSLQKKLGKEPIDKKELGNFLKVVGKALQQDGANSYLEKMLTYIDRPYNEVKDVVEKAKKDKNTIVSAEYVPTSGFSPLMGANALQTAVFLEAGFDVRQRDEYGKTAMHYAKDAGVVELLYEKAPDLINAVDNNNRTPVHDVRDVTVLRKLKELGADLSAQDKNGKTLAHLTSSYEMIMELKNLGANLTVQDNDGNTPLMTNISVGKIQAFAECFGNDVEFFNTKNKKGMSVLDLIVDNDSLAYKQKSNLVKKLINSASVDCKGILKYAKEGKDVKAVVDAIEDSYFTPGEKYMMVKDSLMGKVTVSKIEAIAEFCDNEGIDKRTVFDYKDEKGKTPLINVLESKATLEDKKQFSYLIRMNGGDELYASDYIRSQQQKQKEAQEKAEQKANETKENASKEGERANSASADNQKSEQKGEVEANKQQAQPQAQQQQQAQQQEQVKPQAQEAQQQQQAQSQAQESQQQQAQPQAQESQQQEQVKPQERNLGDVFVQHPELISIYADLIKDKSELQMEAINKAFQSVEAAKGQNLDGTASIEDKIFTSLMQSGAFKKEETEVLFDKLEKAEESRFNPQKTEKSATDGGVATGKVPTEEIVAVKNIWEFTLGAVDEGLKNVVKDSFEAVGVGKDSQASPQKPKKSATKVEENRLARMIKEKTGINMKKSTRRKNNKVVESKTGENSNSNNFPHSNVSVNSGR